MSTAVALLASAIAYGGILALTAVGFLVLYRATGVINFAHGDLITAGAYIAIWANITLGLPIVASYAVAVAGTFVLGVVIEYVAYRPLRNRSPIAVVISTLGVGIIIETIIPIWQGEQEKALASPLGIGSVDLFGAHIANQRILIVIVSFVVVGLMLALFRFTSLGRQLRALAVDRDTARLCGVRSRLLSTFAFGLSGALAALAGVLIAPLLSVDITFGFGIMLVAFSAAILAGFGSLGGTVIAAVIIGVIQQAIGGYFLPSWASTLPFVALLVILVIRPQGLFNALGRARL